MSAEICWLSVDPVRRKVDFYPRAIAQRIEKSFNERDPWTPSACVLGSDFFNATIHFHPSGSCYQTTPGMSMGRAGFKQPGYRSVERRARPTDPRGAISIFAKQVHGEWRLAASEADSEVTFTEAVPAECVVEAAAGTSAVSAPVFRPWTGADVNTGAWDVSVVVWQWCRGVPEKQGDITRLSDDWWCPYLQNANENIEAAHSAGADSTTISLLDRDLTIRFRRDQMWSLQRDEAQGKERVARRMIKTVQEVKLMLDRLAAGTPAPDPKQLSDILPIDAIPHRFFCPILQDVMSDPVKTIDGHTYDRPAIERWFQQHSTSPLTGLPLASKALLPNTDLREDIEAFYAAKTGPSGGGAGGLSGQMSQLMSSDS